MTSSAAEPTTALPGRLGPVERQSALAAMTSTELDVLVIGGGVVGAGAALDATTRGLSTALVEARDFASGTSSRSSKLIHGGLRYLETYEFRLVRESLLEREVLLRLAPHIAWPMRFVLPHDASMRPAWLIRAGLFLYDHLARRRRLPSSSTLDLTRDPAGEPLRPDFARGFDYADCWVDDARLVVLNAMDAAERGAVILTRHECVSARPRDEGWRAVLQGPDGVEVEVAAKVLVNAAGPWVSKVMGGVLGQNGPDRLRLIKGSHIVVPAIHVGSQAYILQNPDRRIVFAIPYQGRFTLIGTTDVAYEGDPKDARIDEGEVDYLCASVNRYFRKRTEPGDVVWSYSGVRPLHDDGAANAPTANASFVNPSTVTRDYVFDLVGGSEGRPVLLSIFGGKITTYRRLAEHAMAKLGPHLGPAVGEAWTGSNPLPGGDMPDGDFDAFLADLRASLPRLPAELVARYARAYGTRCRTLLDGATTTAGLGQDFGAGLFEAEVRYLCAHEWAETADDILWRRSKLGLEVGPEGRGLLENWLARNARRAGSERPALVQRDAHPGLEATGPSVLSGAG